MNMMVDEKRPIRRTRLLINRRFQSRYIGVLLFAALIVASLIGGLLYAIVEMNWSVYIQRNLHLFPQARDFIYEQRYLVFGVFAISFMVLGGLLSLWGLFLSHRIAGPVYAMSRRMKSIVREHDLLTPFRLRKKDSLQEVKDIGNQTLRVLQHQLMKEISVWEKFSVAVSDMVERHPEFRDSMTDLTRQAEVLKKDKEKWLLVEKL